MKFILGVVTAIVVEMLVLLAVIYSGWVDVAATGKDPALQEWVLDETKDHSVKRRARHIQTPRLDDPAMIRSGFAGFDQMCAGCHGAPGRERGGRGFNPQPPGLAAVMDEWKPQELFWITKHGIKMTAMPAFSTSRSDHEIWSVIAFLQTLPDVTPQQYAAMRDSLQAAQRADTTRPPGERASPRKK